MYWGGAENTGTWGYRVKTDGTAMLILEVSSSTFLISSVHLV